MSGYANSRMCMGKVLHVMLIFPDIDECSSNPCAHNGTCIDGVNSFMCSCVDRYTGHDCDTGTKLNVFCIRLYTNFLSIGLCQYLHYAYY